MKIRNLLFIDIRRQIEIHFGTLLEHLLHQEGQEGAREETQDGIESSTDQSPSNKIPHLIVATSSDEVVSWIHIQFGEGDEDHDTYGAIASLDTPSWIYLLKIQERRTGNSDWPA